MKNDQKLTDSGALKTLLFLKALNRFGVEKKEEIRQILEIIDFKDYKESDVWQTLEKTIVLSHNVK